MSAPPKRLQLSRRKGWRLPEGAVNVARPTLLGNPFRIGELQEVWRKDAQWWVTVRPDRRQAVDLFRQWLEQDPPRYFARQHHHIHAALDLGMLRGRDLACWCPTSLACHADVLLELANGTD